MKRIGVTPMVLDNYPILTVDSMHGGTTTARALICCQPLMPVKLQITCIDRSSFTDPAHRIVSIHGGGSGHRWTVSQEDAIRGIERNDWEFYIYRQGKIVNIVVAERDGEKYLKATCDADQPEFLLGLPEWK